MASKTLREDIEEWLNHVFKEQFNGVSEISTPAEGYCGDIIFATVNLKEQGEKSVAIKCSNRSEEVRARLPVQQDFLNEICLYETIFPAFRKFETDRGITDPFSSVAKYFGKFIAKNTEVIVLENLKESGFDLWDRKLPMPKEYLRKVIEEYAKFHAISIAMRDQEPEQFKQLSGKVRDDILKLFIEATDFHKLFETNIDEICDLLGKELDEPVIESWRSLRDQSKYILCDFTEDVQGLKVIIHEDCWCNNFMFNFHEDPQVAILDWQTAKNSSPIIDLSYFLFCSISESDLSSLNDLLRHYHEILSIRLGKLRSSSNLYSLESFLQDWRNYSRFGLLMTNAAIKICMGEKIKQDDFDDQKKNKPEMSAKIEENYKRRMSAIIQFAYKAGLLGK